MDNGLTIEKPFALYKYYFDGSSHPIMIYIGSCKAEAFDALMVFGRKEYFDSCQLEVQQIKQEVEG